MTPASSLPRVAFAAAWSLAVTCFFLVLPLPPLSPDTYFHFAVGRLVSRGTLPGTDPFTFTLTGRAWIAQEWLTGRLLFATFGFGPGGTSFTVWCAVAVAVATVATIGATARSAGCASPLALVAAEAIAALLVGAVFTVRPHLLGLAFLAATGWLVQRYRVSRHDAWLWALPPLFALWANCHASFVVGMLPLAAAMVDLASDRFARARLSACLILCVVACTLNPAGTELLALPFRFVGGNTALATVQEWRPPTLAETPLQLAVPLAAALLIGFAGKSCSVGERLAALATGLLALSARRHAAVAGVVMAPLLARALQAWISRAPRLAAVDRRLGVVSSLAAVMLAGASLLVALPPALLHDFRLPGQFPAVPSAMIRASRDSGQLFNEAEAGGYLAWELGPAHPIFIDFRAELFADTDVVSDYRTLLEARPGWQEVTTRRALGWILVLRTRPIARALATQHGWKLVCADERFLLFQRPPDHGEHR